MWGRWGMSSFYQLGDRSPHRTCYGVYSPASVATPRVPTLPTQLKTHSRQGTPPLSWWSLGRRMVGPSWASFPLSHPLPMVPTRAQTKGTASDRDHEHGGLYPSLGWFFSPWGKAEVTSVTQGADVLPVASEASACRPRAPEPHPLGPVPFVSSTRRPHPRSLGHWALQGEVWTDLL